MTDDITLRSPAADELTDFYGPLLAAFSEEFSAGEAEAERPLMELDRLVNAFDGDRRIGSAGAFSMELVVPGGRRVSASGITAVGVVPDQRRRGVLRRMMTWLLDDAQAHGEPVAVLWASEAAIYQRFGFGQGTLTSNFEADRGRIAFREPLPPRDDVRVRMVDVDAAVRLFPPIFDAANAATPGALRRLELLWRNLILPDHEWSRGNFGMKYRAVLEVDGEARAYVIYRMKSDWSARGPQGTLTVVELFALDPEAEQRLWQWVVAMDLVATVRVWRGPVPSPLQLWLQEPRRLGLTIGDGLWLRFVDLPAALSARTYAGEGSLVLEVDDALIERNTGRWQLTVGPDGTGAVTPTTAEPDLVLDVATLAHAYLGAFRLSDLARAGRVRVCHLGALETADVLFTPSRAPFANTMF